MQKSPQSLNVGGCIKILTSLVIYTALKKIFSDMYHHDALTNYYLAGKKTRLSLNEPQGLGAGVVMVKRMRLSAHIFPPWRPFNRVITRAWGPCSSKESGETHTHVYKHQRTMQVDTHMKI